MTNEQIAYMTERFLAWKLPEGFNPDGGVNFSRVLNEGTPFEYRCEPVGTNLLNAVQAEDLIRYLVDGLPQ